MRRMRIGKTALVLAVLALGWLSASGADEASVAQGVEWLKSRPGLDGSLGKKVDVVSTSAFVLGLGAAGEEVESAKAGLRAVLPNDAQEAALILLATGDGSLGQQLVDMRAGDGSYGTVRVTGLAALALGLVNSPDAQALTYLTSLKNPDGSVGPEGGAVETALTALALRASGQGKHRLIILLLPC